MFALSPANRWSQGQYSHDGNFDGILVCSQGKIRLEIGIKYTVPGNPKGLATVRLSSGVERYAEIHCYEATGIGRKEFKIKRFVKI